MEKDVKIPITNRLLQCAQKSMVLGFQMLTEVLPSIGTGIRRLSVVWMISSFSPVLILMMVQLSIIQYCIKVLTCERSQPVIYTSSPLVDNGGVFKLQL